MYGRIGPAEYRLTPGQIRDFRDRGCCTLEDVLTEEEVSSIEEIFDRFVSGEIPVPGKDFCDMSKSFGVPYGEWSIVNCMLPTRYHPPFRDNIYEKLTSNIAGQLFRPELEMTKDYDQFLNKRPGKTDAVFAWHQDMGYWPSSKVLGVDDGLTTTATFSLAIDDSDLANGCLRYVPGSHKARTLRPHVPLIRKERTTTTDEEEPLPGREEGHALTIGVDESSEPVRYATARRGSVTVHDEYVVHGSGGNTLPDRQRRTYVLAYRPAAVVAAERAIGFTHSHNDDVNWDTFQRE